MMRAHRDNVPCGRALGSRWAAASRLPLPRGRGAIRWGWLAGCLVLAAWLGFGARPSGNDFLRDALFGRSLELNLPELGAEGPATILDVRPCPPIEPDDASGRRLVTSVFRHTAANVVDLETTGSDEPIGTTANHPFWSETRHAFIPAGDLQPGEQLRSARGTVVQVTRITPRRGPPIPVFNLEIDGQHVYSVGSDGVLVHNDCHDIVSMYQNLKRGWSPNWTSLAQDILRKANMTVRSNANLVNLRWHSGPHPELYHRRVYEILRNEVRGLMPYQQEYVDAVTGALTRIAQALKASPTNGLNGIGL